MRATHAGRHDAFGHPARLRRRRAAISPASICQNLGLITTELVLNAAKHAFSGREDGAVSVALLSSHHGVTQIFAIENGCGIEHFATSPRRGVGFVELLASSMGGRCAGYSDPRGARTEITMRRPA